MDFNSDKIKESISCNNEKEILHLLRNGFDPNYSGGWPVRYAARCGNSSIVKLFVQYGANPSLLGASGASTLQLAVYSGKHWDGDQWSFLLSFCDSSQLADGAAVAIIFKNIAALNRILETGRCNTNIPTTLTGKTLEDLAKGYKLQHLLNIPIRHENNALVPASRSPGNTRQSRSTLSATPQQPHRNLSPSVARFFNQTSNQPSLTPPRNIAYMRSPTTRQMMSS